MTPMELVGMVTGILAILGVIVGLTRYITQLQLEVHLERLKTEKELSERRYLDLEARHRQLVDEVAITKRVGTAALTKKMEIDDELLSVMKAMHAGAGSIYIPLSTRSSLEPLGLVFLSIQPFGQQAAALKRKVIPIKSLAGRCFITGEPFVRPSSKTDPEHFGEADLVSGYHTEDTLNFPLCYLGETVGMLQLLNKEGPDRFNPADIPRIEPFAASLAAKVYDFVRVPENLEILGIMPDQELEYATVMFCDLTNSSLLFQEMNASAAIQHINEYLEKLCDIALGYGATVDKYMGDGVLFRFNVPHLVENHPLKAVKAALEMQAAFEKLKADWITMGELVKSLYTRTGIAYGPVYRAVIGHPQYQYLTILGQTVNVAMNLCESAVRDRNIVVIDEWIYKELPGKLIVEQLPRERLGKARAFIASAYELHGLGEE